MRLYEFILTHQDQILAEWISFARSCLPSAQTMDVDMLRDHASEMLVVIATDLKTSQSQSEEADKSKGKRDAPHTGTADTAAQLHGTARAESGFTIEQLFSEYRALRTSVIRLWITKTGVLKGSDLEDLVRFNEAIDQALAESIERHTRNLNHSKEIFLGILGHDLRDPIGSILGAAQMMVRNQESEMILKMSSLILNSGQRMSELVNSLLDFTRGRLGGSIPIERVNVDIGKVCQHIVEEMAALHPQRIVDLEASGELQGQWDKARISQALSNVIGNAIQHGSDKTPVNVHVQGEVNEIRVTVHNWGPVISASKLGRIFDPMYRGGADNLLAPRSHLGLGLYITERIVAAHGGTISVESSEEKGTLFSIHLPKVLPR